jgi:hypothetical protein
MACCHISKTLIRIGYVKSVLYNELKIDYVTKKIILHAGLPFWKKYSLHIRRTGTSVTKDSNINLIDAFSWTWLNTLGSDSDRRLCSARLVTRN